METDFSSLLVTGALATVTTILCLGLWNMMRGGSSSQSQTLMRWRVITQGASILLIMIILYLRH